MSFAAPAARAAAGKSGAGAGAAKATTKAKATAAPDRARQLLGEGTSRKDAARILRDEYGSTLAEAEGLLPTDTGGAGAAEPPAPPATPSRNVDRSSRSASLPRPVRNAANVGGGAILGALSYVLALTYLRGGRDGVKAWVRAKFLNQVEGR